MHTKLFHSAGFDFERIYVGIRKLLLSLIRDEYALLQLTQGRKADVITNACCCENCFFVAVLGNVADAQLHCISRIFELNAAMIPGNADRTRFKTEYQLAQLVHTALVQAAYAEYLALIRIERDIGNNSLRNMLNREDNLVLVARLEILAIVGSDHFSANHQLLDQIGIEFLLRHLVNVNAVSENRQIVAFFHKLIYVM